MAMGLDEMGSTAEMGSTSVTVPAISAEVVGMGSAWAVESSEGVVAAGIP
jgi:hypothetical protein